MLRRANILFKKQTVGILEETAAGGSRFVYQEGWGTDIACCFPVFRREHEWQTGLHPFFEHIGAEGWLREKKARVAHIQQEDDFGLLLKYGADCIGAVGVQSTEPSEVAITELTANPGRTVSGVQKKLLVTKREDGFHPADANGPAPYIAKFNSDTRDDLVLNEFLSLQWVAVVFGLDEITKFQRSRVELIDEEALIVTRFDRTGDDKKLRLEDFAQILEAPRGRDYSGKYNAAYEDIAEAIKKYSARHQIDLQKFFERILAFVVIGNCDAHLKNFSLLERPEGLRLSPVYDVLNTTLYTDTSQDLALSIGGRKVSVHEINRQILEKFGDDIGLSSKAIESSIFKLAKNIERANSKILNVTKWDSPEGLKNRFLETIGNACQRIF